MGSMGNAAPKAPRPGSGRAALAKRVKARGGRERRASAAAARRALGRGSRGRNRRVRERDRSGRGLIGRPVRGAWSQLVRHSRAVQQNFLATQRLRHVLIALAVVWVAWTFLLGDSSLVRLWSVKRENTHLTEEIAGLERRQQALQRDVLVLSTGDEPERLEELAREEHAMVRDGEQLVRFVAEE